MSPRLLGSPSSPATHAIMPSSCESQEVTPACESDHRVEILLEKVRVVVMKFGLIFLRRPAKNGGMGQSGVRLVSCCSFHEVTASWGGWQGVEKRPAVWSHPCMCGLHVRTKTSRLLHHVDADAALVDEISSERRACLVIFS